MAAQNRRQENYPIGLSHTLLFDLLCECISWPTVEEAMIRN